MTMLMNENPNTFEMSYIFSEDVQAGELRSELHDARYTAERVRPAARKNPLSKKERLAEEAWQRFVRRQSARGGHCLATALRERMTA